jgi:hypothetical protein
MMWTYGMGGGWMWAGLALMLVLVILTGVLVFIAVDVRERLAETVRVLSQERGRED